MSTSESAKLTATFSMKVTEKLKAGFDQLNPAQQHRLRERLKYEMARAIHDSKFDPKKYLE